MKRNLVRVRRDYLRKYTDAMMPYITECNVMASILPEKVLNQVAALVEKGQDRVTVTRIKQGDKAEWRVKVDTTQGSK